MVALVRQLPVVSVVVPGRGSGAAAAGRVLPRGHGLHASGVVMVFNCWMWGRDPGSSRV